MLRVKTGVTVITGIRKMVAIAKLLEVEPTRPYEQVMVNTWKENKALPHDIGKDLVDLFGLENLVKEALEFLPGPPPEEEAF